MNFTDLHPIIVHFPIALAIVAVVFNLADYRIKTVWLGKAALALTILAALGAIAAVLSGALFGRPTVGLAETLKEEHALYAVITMSLLIAASLAGLVAACKCTGSCWLKYLFTLLLVAAAVGMALTGMKGGSIVYDVWLFN